MTRTSDSKTSAPDHTSVAKAAGYTLEALLWRDRLNVCYRAKHRHLDRTVLFKVADPASYSATVLLQFLRWEATVLSRIDHPNIVHLYDFGVIEEQAYLLLEYPAGGRLVDQTRGDVRLPLARTLGLMTAVARTVHALHQQGYVHRNLKPSSVWFQADGSVTLADLGLAMSLSDRSMLAPGAGTPAYMAPEQINRTGEIGPSTDVWALGAILYELLTGGLPFGREGWRSERQVAPIPSLVPEVPPWLEGLCNRCLEADPKKRLASAEMIVRTLEHGLPMGHAPSFPYEMLLRFANQELDAVQHASVQRQLAADERWRVHLASVKYLKLERVAAEQDARELARFLDGKKETKFCKEVAATNGDVLLSLMKTDQPERLDLLQHVQVCVYCRRMNRLVQARIVAETHKFPPREKLLREWVLEPIYHEALDKVTAHLNDDGKKAPEIEEDEVHDTKVELLDQGEEETRIILPDQPLRPSEEPAPVRQEVEQRS